jgi:putative transposase
MRRRGMIRDLTLSGKSDGYELAPEWKRKVAERRLWVIHEADRFTASSQEAKTDALKRFAALWNATHDSERVSDKSIYRWKKLYREYGRCGLLPDWGKREARQNIDPRALEFFKKLYFNQNQPSVRSCHRDLVESCVENGWPIPTISALERFVASFPKAAMTLVREGPEAFRNKCLPYIERDPESITANQVWVSDHYEFDVMVKGPNGKPVRPWLTAWVDMRSWKMVSHHIGYSPSTDTIMAAFAEAALDKTIGLPQEIYTDNGRDYCSKEFAGTGHRRAAQPSQEENDRRVQTLVESLKIIPHFALPKNARAKIAERCFRVVAENFCKKFATYTGSNAGKKPEQLKEVLKSPELIPDLQDFKRQFSQWVRLVYNKMESSGKGRRGECPDETFERTRGPIRLASLAEMRLCLMRHSQPVKVGRHGVTLTLTHHATNNNLPSGASITTAAGDRAVYWGDGTTVFCLLYEKADGTAIIGTAAASQAEVNAGSVATKFVSPSDVGGEQAGCQGDVHIQRFCRDNKLPI